MRDQTGLEALSGLAEVLVQKPATLEYVPGTGLFADRPAPGQWVDGSLAGNQSNSEKVRFQQASEKGKR